MNKIIIIMHIYIKLLMTINLKTFLKTLIEKYKRIVLANRSSSSSSVSCGTWMMCEFRS